MAIERSFVKEGVRELALKKFLEHELQRAGLSSISIRRTPLVTSIIVACDRPALVIGKKGKSIRELTTKIEQEYGINKPEIEVKHVEDAVLDPNLIAFKIAGALERGGNPRKIGYTLLQSAMDSGAKGIEIAIGGKLVGKGGRARVFKMRAGYMKKCGHPSSTQVREGVATACCKPGIIGIKVKIVPKGVHFPDEVKILSDEKPEVVVVEGAEATEEVEELQKEVKEKVEEEPTSEEKSGKTPLKAKDSKKVKDSREAKAEKASVEPKVEKKSAVNKKKSKTEKSHTAPKKKAGENLKIKKTKAKEKAK